MLACVICHVKAQAQAQPQPHKLKRQKGSRDKGRAAVEGSGDLSANLLRYKTFTIFYTLSPQAYP